MYLQNGREIYECDEYPNVFIDADTGNFCDEEGNLIGGNIDNGDKPGKQLQSGVIDVPDIVYVSRNGMYYYPNKTKAATIPMLLDKLDTTRYKPSKSYNAMVQKLIKQHMKKQNKKQKK